MRVLHKCTNVLESDHPWNKLGWLYANKKTHIIGAGSCQQICFLEVQLAGGRAEGRVKRLTYIHTIYSRICIITVRIDIIGHKVLWGWRSSNLRKSTSTTPWILTADKTLTNPVDRKLRWLEWNPLHINNLMSMYSPRRSKIGWGSPRRNLESVTANSLSALSPAIPCPLSNQHSFILFIFTCVCDWKGIMAGAPGQLFPTRFLTYPNLSSARLPQAVLRNQNGSRRDDRSENNRTNLITPM